MKRLSTAGRLGLAAAVAATTVAAATTTALAKPSPTTLAEKLVKKTTMQAANRHLVAFQRIADTNDGNRASNTPGYDASVAYVVSRLEDKGFEVTTPTFTYEEEVSVADALVVGSTTYTITKMSESIQTPEGGVTGPLVVVPEDTTTGCEATDYDGLDATGAIAVVRRGGCTFQQKGLVAAAEGAVVAAITNNVAGPLDGVTIGEPGPIPVGGVSKEDGDVLKDLAGATATADMRTRVETRESTNVVAQTATGRKDNVVVAGAHLDAVHAGINDNGSGSAALLEVASRLGSHPRVKNAVRFTWWGAEELGLLGSEAYVAGLSSEERLDIALYLNFDMVGSPNGGHFVYDGDDSDEVGAGPGPYGSAQIEKTFVDFFADRLEVPTQGTDFSGRSDYGPFIAVGIPSGGLFTGAEGIKTPEQAELWGGAAGEPYDPCYHAACDDLGNIDREVMDRNLDAMAWATGVYAMSTADVNGMSLRAERARAKGANKRFAATAVAQPHERLARR